MSLCHLTAFFGSAHRVMCKRISKLRGTFHTCPQPLYLLICFLSFSLCCTCSEHNSSVTLLQLCYVYLNPCTLVHGQCLPFPCPDPSVKALIIELSWNENFPDFPSPHKKLVSALSVFHHIEHSFIAALSDCVLMIHFVAGIWGAELNGLCGKGQVP